MAIIAVFLLSALTSIVIGNQDFCPINKKVEACKSKTSVLSRYLFYDINPPEGFNLRRDVFMRLAIFIHHYSKQCQHGDWHLVLPPWHHLSHWKSMDIGEQFHIKWSLFFDVESIKRFAPVIELEQFFNEVKSREIEQAFVLQHFIDAFSENWEWIDKWQIQDCLNDISRIYVKTSNGDYGGWFWGYNTLRTHDVDCVSFQGSASMIEELIGYAGQARSVLIDHAEIVLHDRFGDKIYWQCRRSMRFSKELREEAARFRREKLNSSDFSDKTVLPENWEDEGNNRSAVGGPYMAVHLRRRDFLLGRMDDVPSLESAAEQIADKLTDLNLNTVFIATDAPKPEFLKLKDLLSTYNVVRYEPSRETLVKFKDGGIAIIDQIICSHARYFTGTHESTYSFRIQEEREIKGFPVETTFNRLCGIGECIQPTRWTIVK